MAGCNDFSQQHFYVITSMEQPEPSNRFSRGHRESPVGPLLLSGSTDTTSVGGCAGAHQLSGWLNHGAADVLRIAVVRGQAPVPQASCGRRFTRDRAQKRGENPQHGSSPHPVVSSSGVRHRLTPGLDGLNWAERAPCWVLLQLGRTGSCSVSRARELLFAYWCFWKRFSCFGADH